jgi:ATP-binding cassette subfamily B protein
MMPMMNLINNLTFSVIAIVEDSFPSQSWCPSRSRLVSQLRQTLRFPAEQVAGLFNTIQSALAGAERVFEVLDADEEEPDTKDAVAAQTLSGEVTFQHVCFSYDGKRKILHDISFHVQPGAHVALVGETGSGKTTIVNLISRAYDCDSGSVLIDVRTSGGTGGRICT